MYGGYFEMFERNWDLCGPGSQGGDRKTLDAHMHLMEAFTNLYECTQAERPPPNAAGRYRHPDQENPAPKVRHRHTAVHARLEGCPADQVRHRLGLGPLCRGRQKSHTPRTIPPPDTMSSLPGCLPTRTDILGAGFFEQYKKVIKKSMDHGLKNGIDWEYGGVYVEGPHAGGVYDMEKEFWQQAEVMIGMLEACLRFGPENTGRRTKMCTALSSTR